MQRFCTSCGAALSSDARFCGQCGNPLAETESEASSLPENASGDAAEAAADLTPEPETIPAPPAAPQQPAIEYGAPPPAAYQPPNPPPPAPPVSPPSYDTAPSMETMSVSAAPPPPPSPPPYAPSAPTPEHAPAYAVPEFDEEEPAGFNKLWVGIGAAALLLLMALYYFIFVADDAGNNSGGTPTAAPVADKIEETAASAYYSVTNANIRDEATTADSKVVGKLTRGEKVGGKLVEGTTAGEKWLELDDGRGFVSLVNLSINEMPVLTAGSGPVTFTLAGPVEMWDAPSTDAILKDRLGKGLTLTASGITQNGYAEIILKKGGVGYIADGQKVIEEGKKATTGPEIAIKIDPNGCAAGSDIQALFDQIFARQAAKRKAIEDADYPNDAARDAALTKYEGAAEGRSEYLKVSRSFKGLSVTGVAQHYESQSVYFADSPEKVRETFRSLGVKVGNDGRMQSNDIYAGIDATPKDARSYGATDLNCGV